MTGEHIHTESGDSTGRSEQLGVLDTVRAAIEARWGSPPVVASLTFVGVEEMQVLRFRGAEDVTTYVTLGMSRSPMTALTSDGSTITGPRAELVLELRDRPDEVWRRLAVLAAAPTVESAVYRVGTAVDLGETWTVRSRCTGAIVSESSMPEVEAADGSVELLRLLPATSNELAWSRVHGSPALRQLWADQAVDLLDIGRPSVI